MYVYFFHDIFCSWFLLFFMKRKGNIDKCVCEARRKHREAEVLLFAIFVMQVCESTEVIVLSMNNPRFELHDLHIVSDHGTLPRGRIKRQDPGNTCV
jgi:hypothetical protein